MDDTQVNFAEFMFRRRVWLLALVDHTRLKRKERDAIRPIAGLIEVTANTREIINEINRQPWSAVSF